MSFGAPPGSALQYPVKPTTAFQVDQAASQAPQANADAAAKMAETQAAKQVATAEGAQAELAAQKAQDQQLMRLASIPGIERSPMGQKAITDRLKTLGVNVPRDESGAIDMAAVKALLTPPIKPWAEWTPKEINDELALDPKLRQLPADAPEEARTKAANVPITEKGYEAIMRPVQMAEAAIGKGQGTYKGLEGAALSAYRALVSRGADTSVIEPYLNADKTGLSDEYVNQQAGALVDAQIDKLHKLGIYYQDETKVREEQIKEKKYEWEHPSAYQRGQLSVQERGLELRARAEASRTSIALQNLQARWASVQNSRENNALRATAFGASFYQNITNRAGEALGKARSQLATTTNIINTMSQNPKMRKSPQFQGLVDQASALQNFIDTEGPTLEAEQATGSQGIANIYSQITGNKSLQMPASFPPITVNVTTPGAAPGTTYGGGKASAIPPGTQPGGTLHGKPIFAVGGKWVFQDGSEAK